MAERVNFQDSAFQDSAACRRWAMLLAEAMDKQLAPHAAEFFAAHQASCPACAALYEEARQGREWLEFLAPEPEVPAGLVERILARTGPGITAPQPVLAGMALPGGAQSRPQPAFLGLMGQLAEPRLEPRLMMTAAMAFFSIALTLNLMGVRLSRVRLSELRPTAVRSFMERRLTMASVPIIRYYDHLHLVYDVQSQMQELWGEYEEAPQQNQNQTQQPGPGESRRQDEWRAPQPGRRGAPAQANAAVLGRYVETALAVRNTGQGAAGIRVESAGNLRAMRKENIKRAMQNKNIEIDARENAQLTLQERAFRPLRNPAGARASERSGVWNA